MRPTACYCQHTMKDAIHRLIVFLLTCCLITAFGGMLFEVFINVQQGVIVVAVSLAASFVLIVIGIAAA